jgi:hypothetical protein
MQPLHDGTVAERYDSTMHRAGKLYGRLACVASRVASAQFAAPSKLPATLTTAVAPTPN